MDAKHIAHVAYEADRTLCRVHDGARQPDWFARDAWQRDNDVCGVKRALAAPAATAEELHTAWIYDRRIDGWFFGPSYVPSLRQDPMLVSWERLPARLRQREELFLAIVRTLSHPVSEGTKP